MNFKKILFIGPEDTFGGIGAVLRIYRDHINDFQFISTYPSKGEKSIFSYFIKSCFTITKFLIIHPKVAYLHIHAASKGSYLRKIIIAYIGKCFGKKIIFHIHAGYFDQFYKNAGIFQFLIRRQLRRMDKVICLTENWYDYFTNELGLENVEVLGNPITLQNNPRIHHVKDVLTLLYLGNLSENKGIFDLLVFLRNNYYFNNNQITLLVGGIGNLDRFNEVLASSTILTNNVHYYGWVEAPMKNTLFDQSDAFILPSYFEGLPVSILEALAYAKPIIATRVGGIPSVVKEHVNGWLFTPGEFTQLEKIFDQIFTDRKILNLYAEKSFEIANQFSPKLILSKLSMIYQSA